MDLTNTVMNAAESAVTAVENAVLAVEDKFSSDDSKDAPHREH